MDLSRRREVLEKRLEFKFADINKKALLWEKCRRDPVFFANYFLWTYDPRPEVQNHKTVFILYDFQEEALRWLVQHIREGKDGLMDKSRDMGATWLVLAAILHQFIFADGFAALLGSRKEDAVDNGQLSSLFGKIDFMIRTLPAWMLPPGFNISRHRNYMKLINPRNDNTIVGEATSPNFSRSGRYSVIFLDEFAFVDESSLIWMATGDASPCRLAVSTPNGKGNKFYELRYESSIDVISLHWTKHPKKTEEWYKSQCVRRTPEEIAQELDISYERSTRGRVFGNELDWMKANGRIGEFPYDPTLPVETSWDFGIADPTAIGFYQTNQFGEVRMIEYYECGDAAIDVHIRFVKSRPYDYKGHYGDIAGTQRSLVTNKSVIDVANQNGIHIQYKKAKKTDFINASKMLLKTLWINEKTCRQFIKSMENYHYKYDETTRSSMEEPVHDWSSHAADQFGYFAINTRGSRKGPEIKIARSLIKKRKRLSGATAY